MHQWLLLSEVFLVFVSLDVLEVVNTAEALDDDLPIKDSAFSEVIKNITRVNNVLQELIKNYEKLQKIYHSQESIEQQYSSQDENMSYGNHQRSKFIVTPSKPKDFPATNFPFEGLDGSPEDVDRENKITTGKSHETRTPPVEAQTLNNNKPKEKREKVKLTKSKVPNKKLKETLPETDSSSDITEEKLGALKKKPKVSKEIKEHDVPKSTKESEKTKAKPSTEQKIVTKKKVITEYGSMERPKRNSSTVNANSTNNNIVMKSRYSPFRNDETAEPDNEAFYKQRKRLDDNKHVFNPFNTENTHEEKSTLKPKSHSKQENLRLGSTDQSTNKKKEVYKKQGHIEETHKKEISPTPIKMMTQPYSNRANDKEEEHKKVRQKKEEDHKMVQQKKKDKELDVVASSEDEKTIKKEQFKTSILRKAYGDACLKVVVRKCYKACKGTLKQSCKVFKCKSNFQLQFKEHAKTGCIYHFRNNNTLQLTPGPEVEIHQPKSGQKNLKQGLKIEDTPKARAEKNGDTDFDGFSDLTRDGYLAAACLPNRRKESIEQQYSSQDENMSYGNHQRSKFIVTPSKPKDFPATNFPFEDLDGSPEDVDRENKITTGKSHETRTPPVEAQTLNNNKPKEKREKVKLTKSKVPNKKLKETLPETDSSSDITEEKLGALKKKPKVSKKIKEHDVPKSTKESEKTKAKPSTEQKIGVAQSSSDKQLNILRDRFERECQKVSCSKCNKACEYTVDKTCATFNCNPDKKDTLRKYCKRECRDSYRSKKKSKSKSSRSDSQSDSRSHSRSRSHSDSDSGSDTDISGTSASSESKTTQHTTHATTAHTETAPPGNATKTDETKLKLRTGRTRKNRNATKAKDRVPKTVEEETFFQAQDTKLWKHTEPTKKYEPVKFVKSQEWKYELASKKKAKAEKQAKKRAEDMVKSLPRSHEVWRHEPETRTVKVRDETAVTVIYRRADHTKS